ncbi:hypothetical protein KW516_05000 [Vibrio fluvialis]|nr:hypothetical protein [Vibrio fluvialis]MBY8277074.1 hypothetical protein [Vibrio fluvialis]
MDEFLGFRRRERLKPSRPTTTKPKALSGYSLCQQRVTGASHRKPPIFLKPKRDKPLNKFQTSANHHQQIPFPQNKKRPSIDGLLP